MNKVERKEYDREYSKVYRRIHKEELNAKKKKYYYDHREEMLKHHKEYYNTRKLEYRARAVKHKFGIPIDEYNRMVAEQNNLCAVCGNPETSTRNGVIKSLAVDHNHKTGKVRKLLCESCNTVIGKVDENVETLTRMIEYLNTHNNVSILTEIKAKK